MHVIAVLIGVAGTLFWIGQSPVAPQVAAPLAPVAHTYRTVDGKALSLHVFTPAAKSATGRPAILLFHGGGWAAGDPEWVFTSARRYADAGLIAVPVQYRLSDERVTPIDALADVSEQMLALPQLSRDVA